MREWRITGSRSFIANSMERMCRSRKCQRTLHLAILPVPAAAARGALGALLRREGLYFSLLTTWRRERASGIREALTARRRGPKSKHNPFEEENQKLHRQVGQLTEKLRKAEIIIDVQKKIAALLGNPIPDTDPDEKS